MVRKYFRCKIKKVFHIWKQNSYRMWQKKAVCTYNSTQKHTVGQINCSTGLERQGSLVGFPWLMQCKELTANSRFRAPCKPTGKHKKVQQGVHCDCLPDKELQGQGKRYFSVVFKEKKLLTPSLEPLGHSRGESNNFKLDICLYKTFPCRKGEKRGQAKKKHTRSGRKRGIWTLQRMLLFSLHRSLRTLLH